MDDEVKKMTIQVHLKEYSSLRDEIVTLINWGRNLVIVSLSISGAIFSFALNNQTYWSALYLVVPLATLTGWLWIVRHWKTIEIGNYINKNLAPKINDLLNSQSDTQNKVLEWEETSNLKVKSNRKIRITEWLAYLMTFVGSGILSLIILLTKTTGSFYQRICDLEFPCFFIINSAVVFVVFFMFVDVLFRNFKYRKK